MGVWAVGWLACVGGVNSQVSIYIEELADPEMGSVSRLSQTPGGKASDYRKDMLNAASQLGSAEHLFTYFLSLS